MDNLRLYLDSLKSIKQMNETDTQKLYRCIIENRDDIIKGNLRLVVKIAFEMFEEWKEVDVLDLIQEGNEGLIKSVDTFEYARGYQFSTYATYRIRGHMLDYIRNNIGPLKLGTTKGQREIINNIGDIRDKLLNEGWTVPEVAKAVDATVADINLLTGQTYDISDPSVQEELVDYNTPESIKIKNEAVERVWRKIHIFRGKLTPVEKCVFDTRLYEKRKTLSQISDAFSLGHVEKVARIERTVLTKAKKFFNKEDLNDIIERQV